MRKCAKCGKVMMSDLRLKVNGGVSHIKQNKQHLHESRRDPVTSYMML